MEPGKNSRRRRAWGLVLRIVFAGCGACAGIGVQAQRPNPPTEAACKAYHRSAYSEWQQLRKAQLACMQNTLPDIRIATECGHLSHQVHRSLRAWPHCFDPVRECTMLIRLDDSYACMKEARIDARKLQEQETRLEALKEAERRIREGQDNIANGIAALDDPKQFLKEKLGAYVERKYLSEASIDDVGGQFTQRGMTVMQETYDYLFGHTAGNPALHASNPIIAAIQGASADALRRVHSQTIHDLEQTLVSMDGISQSAFSSAPSRPAPMTAPAPRWVPAPQAARPAASIRAGDCAILDSPRRTQLATEEPERYQALRARCK
jgi:hypothetical protein